MSVDATMAVLYAQTSLATPFANAAAVGPQAAVAMSRILAAEMARQERQQVEKISKPDQQANITDEKRGGGRGAPFGSRRRRRFQSEPEADHDLQASPLIGNLLNVKV